MSHCNIGVLAPPFMRAALVIDVDPFTATTNPIRSARYYHPGSHRVDRQLGEQS